MKTQKYELVQGNHGRVEKGLQHIYRPGDEIELTDAEAEALGDRIVAWTRGSDAVAAMIFDLSPIKGSVTALKEAVKEIADRVELAALYAAEQTGRNRVSALAALRARLEELGG